MKSSNISFLLISTLYLFLFSSCGSTKKIPGEDIKITGSLALQKLQPPAGKALVYVYRPSGMGGAINMKIFMDEIKIGSTHGKRFLYAFVEPGAHTFMAKAENKSEVPIVIEANKTYFLEQQIKMGMLFARNKLVVLDETEARKNIRKCKLSGNNLETTGF